MVWGFGNIKNDSDQILRFDYAVPAASKNTGTALNTNRGDAILEIGSLGAIYFTDIGHQEGGPHYWAVDIEFNGNSLRWWYDGGGVLDVAVAADGSFVLSGEDVVIQGRLRRPAALGARDAIAAGDKAG